MWSTNAVMRLLRPGDWVVPRCGMCATFWCAIVFIMSSIVLLVTSRHKGRLYQSWGLIMLGCGCCLILICIILCIHAFFVMSAVTRNRQFGLTEPKFELVPAPDSRHFIDKKDELHHLLADSPSTKLVSSGKQSLTSVEQRRTTLTRMTAVDIDDSGSQTSSTCPTSSSSTSTTPPGRFSPSASHAVEPRNCTSSIRRDGDATVGAGQPQLPVLVRSAVAVCRVRPLVNVDWPPTDNQATAAESIRIHGTPTSPKKLPTESSPAADERGQHGFRDNCGDVGEPVRQELGRTSAITVTPLIERRRRWVQSHRAPDNDDNVASSVDDSLTSGYDFAESKATVYDNVQQVYV